MINCISCKEAISEEARVCPKCGHPQFNVASVWGVILGFLAIFIGIGIFLQGIGVQSGMIISFFLALIVSAYGYNKRRTE